MADGSQGNYQPSTLSPTDNSWHFYAVTVERGSSSGIQFYLDGQLMTGTGNPTLHPGSLSNTSALQLGKPTTGSSTNFKGGLDEVELFKKALSGTEVLSLYNAGTAGKCRFPITSVSLQAATEGLAFAFTFTASGAQPPYQWFATGLPSWLTLSAAGVLSGTPPAGSAGNYGLSITANDSTGAKGALSVTLTVNPLPLTITTTSPLPAAKETVSYGTQLTATGGKMPYQWSGTGLPSWLSLSGAGTLSGTPPLRSAGAITFNATVGDSLGSKQSSNFVLPINSASGALTITSPAQLPQATVGAYYSQQLTASGGQPPYVWSEAFTPPGITLSSTGALSGTPTTPGDFGFTASVKDSARGVGVTLLKLPVAALPLTITTPAPIASGVLSFPYSQAFTATGGNGAIHWATAGGSALPQGFSLSADGVLSGTAINPT
ncbi:MAG TPA: putative Ig domain-containing protein, partial [Bryobacteraceae bacterium]|nr:putative Ig domain-containing protein [Bryobacteraceae bacterium]